MSLNHVNDEELVEDIWWHELNSDDFVSVVLQPLVCIVGFAQLYMSLCHTNHPQSKSQEIYMHPSKYPPSAEFLTFILHESVSIATGARRMAKRQIPVEVGACLSDDLIHRLKLQPLGNLFFEC